MFDYQPKIFADEKSLPKDCKKIDAFELGLKEYFFIKYPSQKKNLAKANIKLKKFYSESKIKPIWIYYSYVNTAIKNLPEKIFFELRSSRNRNIITKLEQKNYRKLSVGIAGLSVGSAILSNLVATGGPQNLKIADFDVLEITNLNRIKGTLLNIGENKAYIAARQTWELDPFAKQQIYPNGLSRANLKNFILGRPRLDVFVDEMDDLALKTQARLICQKHKIPVLMATDNGDGILLDVERYDNEKIESIFLNRLSKQDLKILDKPDYQAWLKLAIKLLDINLISNKIKASLPAIGKTIPAIPQLGSTANLVGAAMVYALRKIANRQNLPTGRYVISFEQDFKKIY